MKGTAALMLVAGATMVAAETYYKETFDGAWEDRWVTSNVKEGETGKWGVTAGKFFGDAEADKGLQTTQDAKFYFGSSKLDKPFSNEGKDLVLQFSVKHEQKIDCGGGYIKLHPSGIDQANYDGDSDYNIMFGPDICGATKRVHVIFTYKGKNLLTKKTIPCETDALTHVYTLILKADNTYEVRIDGEKKEGGSLEEDWDFLLPKEIKDPEESKPADWVNDSMMDDPEDVKPEGYDDIEKQIVDPDAEKPDDWDEEDDGEWEAPMVANPDYKGAWKAKRIENPDYKGPWEHPMIANPDYVKDENLYQFTDNAMVGFDLWQVKSGTIFDNILVTDSVSEAEAFMAETFTKNKDAEKAMYDTQEAAKKAEEEEERKKIDEERKKAEDEDDEDEDEEEPVKEEL